MKKAKYVFIMLMSLMISISCNNDDDDMPINDLVGTWAITEAIEGIEVSIAVTFNEDLTGTMVIKATLLGQTEEETQGFTWSTEGDQLTMNLDGDSETSGYSISGNSLTINFEDQETLVLTRQ